MLNLKRLGWMLVWLLDPLRELIITFRALPELQGIELSNKENNTKNMESLLLLL